MKAMMVSKKIVSALKEIYKPTGYSIMQNGGEFNDIGHYHLPIFPRYVGDEGLVGHTVMELRMLMQK